MDKYQGITNRWIDQNKNVMTKIARLDPTRHFGSPTTIYGRRFSYDVPREYNNLSQIYIKATFSVTGDPDPQTAMGTRVLKLINLRGKSSGSIIATCVPDYSIARLDEITNTPLYSQISQAVEPDADVSGVGAKTGVNVIIPFPAWFNRSGWELPTRYLEDLELECVSNDSKEDMGLLVDLTAITYEAIFKYKDNVFYDENPFPAVMYGYNMYSETSVSVDSGATSAEILVNCPFPVFCSHVMAKSATQNFFDIERIEVFSANVEIMNVDKYTLFNYDESSNNIGIAGTGSVPLYWSQAITRDVMSNDSYVAFNGSMYPVKIKVYFRAAVGSAGTLSVVNEYKQVYDVSDTGVIRTPNMGSFEATGKQGLD